MILSEKCILCNSEVSDHQTYMNNKKKFVRTTRYQGIIDVLLDTNMFSRVHFDHDTELSSPYREIAYHLRSALQKESGKGRGKHCKWPDIVGIKGDICDIIIEEERQPNGLKIRGDLDIITPCNYLWTNRRTYNLNNPTLFILINDTTEYPTSVKEKIGSFSKAIVCMKNDFPEMFERYYIRNEGAITMNKIDEITKAGGKSQMDEDAEDVLNFVGTKIPGKIVSEARRLGCNDPRFIYKNNEYGIKGMPCASIGAKPTPYRNERNMERSKVRLSDDYVVFRSPSSKD